MMFTWVGLANRPLDLSNKQSSHALLSDFDSSMTIAFSKPRPRTRMNLVYDLTIYHSLYHLPVLINGEFNLTSSSLNF
jgi:hypothetical protein